MTTANIAQTITEAIGSNPNPPAAVASTIAEVIGSNPNAPAVGAQVYAEVIIVSPIGMIMVWNGVKAWPPLDITAMPS